MGILLTLHMKAQVTFWAGFTTLGTVNIPMGVSGELVS